MQPSELSADSALWTNAFLCFTPLLPFVTFEAGMLFVQQLVLLRRQQASVQCDDCPAAPSPTIASFAAGQALHLHGGW
jgi:hypothetical protein